MKTPRPNEDKVEFEILFNVVSSEKGQQQQLNVNSREKTAYKYLPGVGRGLGENYDDSLRQTEQEETFSFLLAFLNRERIRFKFNFPIPDSEPQCCHGDHGKICRNVQLFAFSSQTL